MPENNNTFSQNAILILPHFVLNLCIFNMQHGIKSFFYGVRNYWYFNIIMYMVLLDV